MSKQEIKEFLNDHDEDYLDDSNYFEEEEDEDYYEDDEEL